MLAKWRLARRLLSPLAGRALRSEYNLENRDVVTSRSIRALSTTTYATQKVITVMIGVRKRRGKRTECAQVPDIGKPDEYIDVKRVHRCVVAGMIIFLVFTVHILRYPAHLI